jgi:type I restriction enzyme S subunit
MVDPSNHRDEEFDLYSIPAYDTGKPEIVRGRSVGSAKQLVQPGDVLLARIVPHIRRAWIVAARNDRRQIASGEWIVFRSREVFPNYLRHALLGNAFHAEFMRTVSGVGGSLLRARPSYVAQIRVLLPSMTKQRRIAAILDNADALRANRRAALAQVNTLTRSVFVNMFGDGKRSPRTWPQTSLGDVTQILTGYPFRSDQYVGTSSESVPLCRGATVLPTRIDWSDLACWPRSKTTGLDQFWLRTGDIVVALDRPWISEGFKIARLEADDCPALLVQRVARIRPLSSVSTDFLFELLKQPNFTRHCRPTETTVPHISPTEIRAFEFPFPRQTCSTLSPHGLNEYESSRSD